MFTFIAEHCPFLSRKCKAQGRCPRYIIAGFVLAVRDISVLRDYSGTCLDRLLMSEKQLK